MVITTPAPPVGPRARTSRRQWLVPVWLIMLSLVPMLAGVLRLTELTGGGTVTESNARFFGSPAPVVIHIVGSTVFCLLGAFQFVPALRGRRRWHRLAGFALIPMGLASALSGMWMAVAYDLPAYDGVALIFVRLFFGAFMAASILIAIRAIVRRDFAGHGAWMTRAYALALAAGTQAVLLTTMGVAFDTTDQLVRVVGMGGAWIINLGIAEIVIRLRRGRGHRRGAAVPTTMRAAVYRRFGGSGVVNVESIEAPTPAAGELLIRVHASTVSAADHRARSRDIPAGLRMLAGLTLGFHRPRRPVLGMDLAGVVEAVGTGVTSFGVGDEVVGMRGSAYGGHAEYTVMRADGPVARMPRNMSFDQAVTLVFGGITARGFLNQVEIAAGTTVLVNGASGAVGTAAIQLATHLGAEVTAVTSGRNRELVNELGADHVIDYTMEDFWSSGRRYDVIVDCVGNLPFAQLKATVEPGGAVLHVISDFAAVFFSPVRSRAADTLFTAAVGPYRADDLRYLVELAEAGRYRAVIDRTYDLADITKAHRYVDTGRKRGNVVIRITASGARKCHDKDATVAPRAPVRGDI